MRLNHAYFKVAPSSKSRSTQPPTPTPRRVAPPSSALGLFDLARGCSFLERNMSALCSLSTSHLCSNAKVVLVSCHVSESIKALSYLSHLLRAIHPPCFADKFFHLMPHTLLLCTCYCRQDIVYFYDSQNDDVSPN